MIGKRWSTMCLAGVLIAASSCATTERHASQEELVGALSSGLDIPSVPNECVQSLRVSAKDLRRISGVVDQLPEGARYGIFARLGGSYLYSRFILLIPRDQVDRFRGSPEWMMGISAAKFEELDAAVVNYRVGFSSMGATHDECNLLYLNASSGDRSAVILSSDIEGLDSVPLDEMSRAIDLVVAHLEHEKGSE